MAAMVPVAAITATVGTADTSTEQTFEVASSGDNSNQCSGVQGVTNTAPVGGGIDLLQYNSEAEDFEFDEVGGADLNILQADAEAGDFEFEGGGAPLTVGGANETACDQKGNQA